MTHHKWFFLSLFIKRNKDWVLDELLKIALIYLIFDCPNYFQAGRWKYIRKRKGSGYKWTENSRLLYWQGIWLRGNTNSLHVEDLSWISGNHKKGAEDLMDLWIYIYWEDNGDSTFIDGLTFYKVKKLVSICPNLFQHTNIKCR